MNAKEARKILNDSDAYLKSLLETVFKDVTSQSKQGLNWAHVNVKVDDHDKFIDRLKTELIILGYTVENFNSSHNFMIKW